MVVIHHFSVFIWLLTYSAATRSINVIRYNPLQKVHACYACMQPLPQELEQEHYVACSICRIVEAGLSEPGVPGILMAPPDFGRSVNPISTRGSRLCPHISARPLRFSDLAPSLRCSLVSALFMSNFQRMYQNVNDFRGHFFLLDLKGRYFRRQVFSQFFEF